MTEENTKPTVGEMLRTTGNNTAQFMSQIAEHVDFLEREVQRLTALVTQLESK